MKPCVICQEIKPTDFDGYCQECHDEIAERNVRLGTVTQKHTEEKTRMFDWLIKRIKDKYELFWIEELQVGGHCGLCGKWISEVIVPNKWAITVCQCCANDSTRKTP